MRLLILVPLAALAACGGEAEKPKEARAARIDAGQWESSLEVTTFRKRDDGDPVLDMPVGTRVAGGACVEAAQAERPPASLFIGSPFDCDYTNLHMRNARISGQLTCRHPEIDGEFGATVVGRFAADSFDGEVQIVTQLPISGDVIIALRASGRRTGSTCTPAAEGGGNQTGPS